jgi:hypothetical protein
MPDCRSGIAETGNCIDRAMSSSYGGVTRRTESTIRL